MHRSRLLFYLFVFVILLLVPFLPGLLSQKGTIALDQVITASVFDKFDTPQLLVFFGYVGCADVCTPRLSEIASVYDAIPAEKKSGVGVVFINIKTHQDRTMSDIFAKSFHPRFHGMTPGKQALAETVKQFNVYYGNSLFEQDEMDHTAFLFLLQKEDDGYHLRKIFTQVPFQSQTIIKSLE